MPTATNDNGNEHQTTKSLPDQLNLSGLPLVFDQKGVYRQHGRTRPRLEDFLKQKNRSNSHIPKSSHYPLNQAMPPSPQFGAPEFQTFNPEIKATPLDEKPENLVSIRFPAFLITIREKITRYIIEWWLLELISWFIGAFSVAALVIVLRHFDGQAITHSDFGLTLNALISLLAGFTRASLLIPTYGALGQLKWNWFRGESKLMVDFEIFDSASRGPLGSIFLLFRTCGK